MFIIKSIIFPSHIRNNKGITYYIKHNNVIKNILWKWNDCNYGIVPKAKSCFLIFVEVKLSLTLHTHTQDKQDIKSLIISTIIIIIIKTRTLYQS